MQRVIVDWAREIGQSTVKEPDVLLASQGRPGAGAQRRDAGNLPAPNKCVHESTPVHIGFTSPKRKLIDPVGSEDMIDVFGAVAVVEMHVHVPREFILI